MSRKALLTTLVVVMVAAVAWLWAGQVWRAFLRLHGH
jgi:hypothetical protein